MSPDRKSPKGSRTPSPLPSEEQILEFVRESPGMPGKREIARAFNIRGSDRVALKKLLKSMADKGLIDRRRKRMLVAGTLPPVAVLIVTGRDEDGELVARPEQWDEGLEGTPPGIVVLAVKARGTRAELQPPKEGDRILARLNPIQSGPYAYEARLIRRLIKLDVKTLGIYRRSNGVERIVPVDKRERDEWEIQPGESGGARDSDLVEVRLTRDRGRGLKTARVVQRLGSVADQRNISLIAAHQHGIKLNFGADTLKETAALKPFRHTKARRDLRKVALITIDPADARDHDDAVWAQADDDPANPGGFQVIVAIADVAHYIHPGSALDREARERGNSVYFPDRVIPMLPERISTDLCSLKQGTDRPALACSMTFNAKGTKIAHKFERATIRSHASLSYEQAQAAIDGRPDSTTADLLEPVLRPLWQAHAAVEKARKSRAPLELELPERKLVLDDRGYVERVHVPDRLQAHRLIEEFMIQANVSAAETLEEHAMPFPYRVHEAPSADKIVALGEFLRSLGLSSPKGQVMKPRQFNDLLRKVEGQDFQQIVHDVVLRTQSQAIYSPHNQGHFGLNLRRYTHFTSPIRRYSDLLVHRALIDACKLGRDGLSDWDISNLSDTTDWISGTERRAMLAERDTSDRLLAAYLSDKLRARFWGRISGVTRSGLFIRLDETGADGFVPAASIAGDYYVHDEARHALVGAQSGETYQLADPVEVRLLEVTPVAGGLRFEILSDGKRGKPAGRKQHRGRPAPRRHQRRR